MLTRWLVVPVALLAAAVLAAPWGEAAAGQPVKVKGMVKTETDQAAPNGFSVQLLRRNSEVVSSGTPERVSGEFSLDVAAASAGDELTLSVKDPMGKPVPMRKGSPTSLKLDDPGVKTGVVEFGVARIELPPQEPVEAFAFGGRVYDKGGKPLPAGYVMHVATLKGDRKTSEDIVEGKFALIFIDLQGEFPRIQEGDRFRFTVKDRNGKDFPVAPDGYTLTRTDIANSSISTLEFKVQL